MLSLHQINHVISSFFNYFVNMKGRGAPSVQEVDVLTQLHGGFSVAPSPQCNNL